MKGRDDWTSDLVGKRARRAIRAQLRRAGVRPQDLDDCYHDVLIRAVEKVDQLKDPSRLFGWLRSKARDMARAYRPLYIANGRKAKDTRPADPPKEIGRKGVMVDGNQYTVRVFESPQVVEQPCRRRQRFAELTETTLWKQSCLNVPDYGRAIDTDALLSQLPVEMRQVIRLRYYCGLSYEGIASALGAPLWEAKRLLSEAVSSLRQLCGVRIIQIERGCELTYFPQFLREAQANAVLSGLLSEVPFQPEHLKLVGREFTLKRQTAQFGANYAYNPCARKAIPWARPLIDLKFMVELTAGMRFDSALCNLYPDGDAYIGWHHDSGHPRLIASVSVGAVRELRFAGLGATKRMHDIELAHGSLLLIPEVVNERFKHMVPKSAGVTQPRVNVTFRTFHAA
jgi:RNA polymerase sigma factor (sigma-70 family)